MITYYVDGSVFPNPSPEGHGAYAVIKNGKHYMVGREFGPTSNIRQEALGIIAALEDADGEECTIYTDSLYWVDTLHKWAPLWREQGWKRKPNRENKEVANLDLVKLALDLYERGRATLVWCRGHNGTEGNEMADKLAGLARKAFMDVEYMVQLPRGVLIGEYTKEE